jgi:PIN domain nuclease of toxin-antitoxin system
VGQLIDWIDQAILLVYTSDDQSRALAKLGIIRASDVLANTLHETSREELTRALGEKKADALQISEVIGGTVNSFSPDQAAQALAEIGKIETRAIDTAELMVLTRGLQSALNMELVTYYRWKTSLNATLRDHVEEHAAAVAVYHTAVPTTAEPTPPRMVGEAAPAS